MRARRSSPSRPRDERGSMTPLIIGFTVVVALVVAVVVDASAAYLRRQGLNATADAAAENEGVRALERLYPLHVVEVAEVLRVVADAVNIRLHIRYSIYP